MGWTSKEERRKENDEMNRFRLTMTALALSAISLIAATCDAQVQSVAVRACSGLDTAYSYYDEIKASGILSARYTVPVDAIRVETDKACASPSTLTATRAAGLAARAYLALKPVFQASLGQGDRDYAATKGLEKLEELRVMLEKYKE